LFVLYEKK
ncbi:hypothetical protein wTpre_147B, partial [Wolbachia endosymbiont of Trichogramma pretiosum]